MTRVGLIGRADNSGLGTQTWEFARHMKPAKTMVIDVGHLADAKGHCNKHTYRERYPDATFVRGWHPSHYELSQFLNDIDVVFTCETPYSYALFPMAKVRGIKTVLQYNWELLEALSNPMFSPPDLYAAPTAWCYEQFPWDNRILLPVPVAEDRFIGREVPQDGRRVFLHIAGRPADHDRNGTQDLIRALMFVTQPMDVVIRCQQPGYLNQFIKSHTPSPYVTLTVIDEDVENYWDNYAVGDVMVLPRRYGGLCLPAQEALAAGMPVIMPNVDPNNELLPDAWLTSPMNLCGHCGATYFKSHTEIPLHATGAMELALLMDKFARDEGFFHRSRTAAVELAHIMSWEELKPVYDTTFESLLSGDLVVA